jgi:hypothetical protein
MAAALRPGGLLLLGLHLTDYKNSPPDHERWIGRKPGIRVVGAAAFAITIERPEGTWVSDMKRRVVIASKG